MSAPLGEFYPARLEGVFESPREALAWIAPKIGFSEADIETAMAWSSHSLVFSCFIPGGDGNSSVLIQQLGGKYQLWRALMDLRGEFEDIEHAIRELREAGAQGEFAIFQFTPAPKVRAS